ncbi:MAG: ABC transporter permease [Methanosarcinales archaeon]
MNLENPVLIKELRERMRGRIAFILLTVYLLFLFAVLFLAWPHISRYYPGWDVGREIFQGISMILMAIVVFITPSFTSGAISSERERKTLDLLITTLLKPRTIVFGKMIASLSYLVLLLAASLPFISVSFMFGGVAPSEVATAYFILIVTMFTVATIAMFFSILFKKTFIASGASYGIILFLVLGTIFLDVVLDQYYLYREPILSKHLNPFFAITSIYERGPTFIATSIIGLKIPAWGNVILIYTAISIVLLFIILRYFEPLLKRGGK